ncbi:AI-2E family transporter [Catenulispora yoronensis]|uniref:AI-2E family transporter n=1 Tax=Catenulispora yoronensis TaxID=450799 RepID=A0ABP5GZX4_9ACTN
MTESAVPRWLPRALALALLFYAGFLISEWALGRLKDLLITLLVSMFVALAIEPAVDAMARRGMRRGVAVMFVFVVLLASVALFVFALGSLFVDQVVQFAGNLPHYVDSVVSWVNRTFDQKISVQDLQSKLLSDSNSLKNYAEQLAGNVWGVSSSVLGGVFKTFTVALFTFYLAADAPKLRAELVSLFPPGRQGAIMRAWKIALEKTGGYIYSRALMALVSGVAHGILFWIIGLPYALALAIWVGLVSQFIPTVGTYLAGALPILIALTNGRPGAAIVILAFVVVYQQFENYILQPRITAKTVEIHPAVAFGAVIAGAALLGGVGAIIAIPLTATVQSFVSAYITRYEVAEPEPAERGSA